VRDDDLAVEVIRRERMFLKKIPLRHVLVVKNFNTQEFGQREIRCFFLRNRLMSVLFVPKLSEGECKALLKGDYKETVLEGMNLSRERKDASYYQGECTGDDRLEIVEYTQEYVSADDNLGENIIEVEEIPQDTPPSGPKF
jgi:hypothetical protein